MVRMTSIEEAYHVSLRVEEELNKNYDGRQVGDIQGGRGSGRSFRGEMRTNRKMKMWVLVEIRGMRVLTTPVIKTLEIREEEVEDIAKVQEEEASMVLFFIKMKKVIMHLNALNNKEG